MSIENENDGATSVGLVMINQGVAQDYPFGHTAIMTRLGGKIGVVRGFVPAEGITATQPAAVRGHWVDDIKLAQTDGAISAEWPVEREDAVTLATFLTNDVATMKWRYHFASIRTTDEKKPEPKALASERVRNCAHNALHVLKYQGPEEIRHDIEKIKKSVSAVKPLKTQLFKELYGLKTHTGKGVLQSELIQHMENDSGGYGCEIFWG